LEGIISWWLPANQRRIGRQRIEATLSEMVADGLLKATTFIDGTVLYSRGKLS
jgi:hypothetical protein